LDSFGLCVSVYPGPNARERESTAFLLAMTDISSTSHGKIEKETKVRVGRDGATEIRDLGRWILPGDLLDCVDSRPFADDLKTSWGRLDIQWRWWQSNA